MQALPVGYCQCGCGEKTKVVSKTDKRHGYIKGESRKYIRGHYNQHNSKNYLRSPFVPGVAVHLRVRKGNQPRWQCKDRATKNTISHARLVYKYLYGEIPDGYHIHHKNGRCSELEDDAPDNLLAVPSIWNARYFPVLAKGFNVPESIVTQVYCDLVDIVPAELLFSKVCRVLINSSSPVNPQEVVSCM
jgi:hypothetical protein